MFRSLVVALILVQALHRAASESAQLTPTDNDVYILEHSIDTTSDFKEIGKLNLRTIRQNQNSAQFQSMTSHDESSDENRYASVSANLFVTRVESNDFDADTQEQLAALQDSSEHTLYRLRLCKKGGSKACFTSTFTYLRSVLDARMRLNLTIYTGVNNYLNSISIKTWPAVADAKETASVKRTLGVNAMPNHLELFVCIQNIRQAMGPDTETYLDKVKKEMEQKEKSAQGGNESFLSKYWIYIVPVVIIMFLMNLANPEGAGGGQ